MVFEVCIVLNPSKKDIEDGNLLEKILLNPTVVVAADQQGAAIAAVMDHPNELKDADRSRLTVHVRPFSN